MVDLMTKSRTERAAALEAWAEKVDSGELTEADTTELRLVAELVRRRGEVDGELLVAVKAARSAGRSWSELAAMLGVSKQAAQQKYGPLLTRS
jgi:hypothetical protein